MFVRMITGKSIVLRVIPDMLIGDIKRLVHLKEGLTVGEQRLIFAGKQLNDSRTYSDYNMKRNSTMHLVLRLRAGNALTVYDLKSNTDIILNDTDKIKYTLANQMEYIRQKHQDKDNLLDVSEYEIKYDVNGIKCIDIIAMDQCWVKRCPYVWANFKDISSKIIKDCEEYTNIMGIKFVLINIKHFKFSSSLGFHNWVLNYLNIITGKQYQNQDINIKGSILKEINGINDMDNNKTFRYHNESIDMNQYGCVMGSHIDDCDYTFDICLGGQYNGGNLVFHDKYQTKMIKVEHKIGEMIVFNRNTIHYVNPIQYGYRINMILDISIK